MTSIPEITRLLAKIQDWQDGQAKGRAETALRLNEAHKLFGEVSRALSETRREMLGGGNRLSSK